MCVCCVSDLTRCGVVLCVGVCVAALVEQKKDDKTIAQLCCVRGTHTSKRAAVLHVKTGDSSPTPRAEKRTDTKHLRGNCRVAHFLWIGIPTGAPSTTCL